MSKLITIIFSATIFNFIFISCDDKKDENTTKETYPCIYVKEKVEYFPVALYSSKDITYDRTKIEAFVEYLSVEQYKKVNNDNDDGIKTVIDFLEYFVFEDMIEYYDNEIIAQQVSKDSIEITHPDFIFSGKEDQWGNLIYEKGRLSALKEKNGTIYWESKDTTSVIALYCDYYGYHGHFYIMGDGDPYSRVLLRSIFDSLTPLYYVESQSPDIMGLNFFSQSKYCLYLAKSEEGIYIPYMEILYKNQGKIATYKLNNIPLPNNQIISKIAEGDTLVLQQSRLYLLKYSKTN